MFERFTDGARRVMPLAQEESRVLCHHEIGSEHLLLGLLHDDASDLGQAMAAVGVTLFTARVGLEQFRGRGRWAPDGHIPFTPHAKAVLEEALQESLRLGQDYIDTPHLLLAILTVTDCTAVKILQALNVDADRLRRAANEIAEAGPPSPPQTSGDRAVASHGRRGGGTLPKVPRRLQYSLSSNADDLARALLRYGQHEDGCKRKPRCTCGLQPLLDLALDNIPPSSET